MIHEQFPWPEVPGLTQGQVMNLGRQAKPASFWETMQAYRHAKNGCAFCDTKFLKGTIVFGADDDEPWFILKPNADFNRHSGVLLGKFVIVLKRHIDDPTEQTDDERIGMGRAERFLKEKCGMYASGGMDYMRFGPTTMNAGTVSDHLHRNVDEPNGQGEVRPPIYKDHEGWEKDFSRLHTYLAIYKDGMGRDDFVSAYELVFPSKKKA